MKVGIIGPGALGTYLGGILSQSQNTLIIGKDEMGLEKVKIKGKTKIESAIEYSTDYSRLSDMDYIFLCTKSYDTEDAMECVAPYLEDDFFIVSLQNGLKNEAIISRYVSADKVIGGVTNIGVTYQEAGSVIHAGKGKTVIGPYSSRSPGSHVKKTAEMLSRAGMSTEIADNVYGHIWRKVIINASINPLTALTGLRNGELLEIEELHLLMKSVTRESEKVAEKEVNLPGDEEMFSEVEKVARLTSENISSMLQDVRNKKKTEIGCITGAIVDVGENEGVKTPYNRVLYHLVKGLENSYLG